MTPREEAERIARALRSGAMTHEAIHRRSQKGMTEFIESALRAAEARGEQRGRVQGLRDAAVMALEDFQQIRAGGSVFSSWLRARADAIDQQPLAETPDAR